MSKSRKKISVLGVIERDSSFTYSIVRGNFDSSLYIKFMNKEAKKADKEFKKTGKLTFVIEDNCSIHKSKEVKSKFQAWRKQGLLVYFLPPYSPQMNRIEGEWLQIKYRELGGRCFSNEDEVEQAFLAAVESR